MKKIIGLSEITDIFDAVAIDQYGVLHDGQTAFDGALQALQALKSAGKPVVALTNSGKLSATNAARLARFGFAPDLFAGVVSSGQVARHRLKELPPGTIVQLVTRDGETELLDGLDLRQAEAGDNPSLIVLAGVRPSATTRDDYARLLTPLARTRTPMLLVNPDLLMTDDGGVAFGPGAVAEDYRRAGGPVTSLGKPAPEMFRTALTLLGNPDAARVLMIGDSPEHDISGASRIGMQTLLIEGGVQASLHGASADYCAGSLRW